MVRVGGEVDDPEGLELVLLDPTLLLVAWLEVSEVCACSRYTLTRVEVALRQNVTLPLTAVLYVLGRLNTAVIVAVARELTEGKGVAKVYDTGTVIDSVPGLYV